MHLLHMARQMSMHYSSNPETTSMPTVTIPARYNAAHDLIERNLMADRRDKPAYIDDRRSYTYGELAERVNRCASALTSLGLQMEQRVLLCLQDTIDFPTAFLGAIKAGVVPVAVNTLLKGGDYEYMLCDSRAIALVVSQSLLPELLPCLARSPFLKVLIVSGTEAPRGAHTLDALLTTADASFSPAPTFRDEPCFWLYSSGSTGTPKGTVHVHSSMVETAVLYGHGVLGIAEHDLVFSAAKLFFAYGLGNSLSFPLSVGATTVLMAERPTPAAVIARLRKLRPTIFHGVPTLYAALLASGELPTREETALRLCVSAGEALPEDVGRRWRQRFGVDILDGIGSTEMLHIFISNRPADVRYGTLGTCVPGYEARVVDDHGQAVAVGEIGDLLVRGPTSADHYWCQRERSRATFQGLWTRTGDKCFIDPQGSFVYAGRADDMLKVSGLYVSPVEVESALVMHPAVLEAAVVGKEDPQRLVKPMAFIVLARGHEPSPVLAQELQQFVKSRLAPYKYPRWIEFVTELPRTATGKIQRFKLRARAASA